MPTPTKTSFQLCGYEQ